MGQLPFAALFVDDHENIIHVNEIFMQATGASLSQLKGEHRSRYVTLFGEPPLCSLKPFTLLEGEIVTANKQRLFSTVGYQRWRDGEDCFYLFHFVNVMHVHTYHLVQRFANSLISDIDLGVLVVDQEGRLVALSDLACRLLGVTREDVLHKSLAEVFPEIPNEQQLIQKNLLDGVTVRNKVTSWTNGKQRYELLLDSNLLFDEMGHTVGAYVIFKDITQLRSLDEQIQRSDRLAMIGQIAAGTAHEIRNPLTSIKGFLQVLKYGLVEKGLLKEQEYTDIMLKEIDRINDLVSEFLLLSKPRHASYEEVDVAAVFSELLPIIRNEALLHNVDVHYEREENVPPVIADSELLKQVFLNLCKNGIEAMVEGGKLTVRERLASSGQEVVIDIQDTGPGIPYYVIDKIFDPFFTTKENGTGLGLPVCQRIIHDIGGNIRASTKGFGTTFSVFIPCRYSGLKLY